jgi:hypothetical protein
MKALILYTVFVAIGAVAAGTIGYFVEIEMGPAMSLIVFLSLFFLNFVASWLAVILVMDGTLKDWRAEKAQLAIEAEGRKVAARSPAGA